VKVTAGLETIRGERTPGKVTKARGKKTRLWNNHEGETTRQREKVNANDVGTKKKLRKQERIRKKAAHSVIKGKKTWYHAILREKTARSPGIPNPQNGKEK